MERMVAREMENGAGGLRCWVRRVGGRLGKERREDRKGVGLYQWQERGRFAHLATFVVLWPGGDDDEEIEAGREGCSRPAVGEVMVMWVE